MKRFVTLKKQKGPHCQSSSTNLRNAASHLMLNQNQNTSDGQIYSQQHQSYYLTKQRKHDLYDA